MTDRKTETAVGSMPNGLYLTVDGGVHHGARVTLPLGSARVGSDLGNDIVVSDLPGGTSFRLDQTAGAISLQAEETGVSLPGDVMLHPGQSRSCSGEVSFACGGIAFRVVGLKPSMVTKPASKRMSRTLARRVALAAVLAIAFVTLMPGLESVPAAGGRLSHNPLPAALMTSASAAISTDVTGAVPAVSPKLQAMVVAPSANTPAQLATLLRQRLVASGLDAVALVTQPDGSLEAKGQVSPQREVAWRDVSRWFDGVAGGRLVLVDQVRFAVEAPPLALQAVWPGRHPYVIDGDGEKLFVGTVLSSGWTISGISADRVLIKRGDQLQAVRF